MTETVLQSRVPPGGAGLELSAWLAARFRYLDRDGWRAEIDAGRVQRNGRPASAGEILVRDDRIAYRPPEAAPRVAVAPLHDDPELAVVFKPAYLVAHEDGAFVQNTFFRALQRHYADRGELPRLALVHRLDKETSGLLLVAKTRMAAAALQRQFAAGTVLKEYLAIVHGVVEGEGLEIDAPIGPDPRSAVAARRAACASGTRGAREARTSVRVERRCAGHTLVRAVPHTGRTHQIRVHLTHAGHPLVGDKLYGRSDDEYLDYVRHLKAGGDPAWDDRLGAGRQMLHGAVLEFEHPVSGRRLRFESPMPDDMRGVYARIGCTTSPATSVRR